MNLDDLRALISVLEHGSVQAAAKALAVPRSTLRRRIESLEASVGVPLLVRDASGALPTPAGQALAVRGRPLIEESAALVAAVRDLGVEPEGLLRVLAPVGIPSHLAVLVLGLARERFPKLEFRCMFSEDPLRELRDDADIVLHFGAAPTSGAWVTTTLIRAPERLLASPEYLASAGIPDSVEALASHTLLSWRPPGEDGRRWPLRAGGSVAVSPVFVSADVHLVRQLAASGLGIGLVPDASLPEVPDQGGALQPVLEGCIGRPCALRALIPEATASLPRGRAALGLLRELISGLGPLSGENP